MTAGYSGTPLSKKLGIREAAVVGMFGGPPEFPELLDPLPAGVTLVAQPHDPCDVLILFTSSLAHFQDAFSAVIELLPATGGLWVAWPKKSSGVVTDLSENAIRDYGLEFGVVDNKVCAIDATWSGLRFVVRIENRAGWPHGRSL